MFAELPITEFLDRVASDTPTPGGGSTAALEAATSASLVEMVAGLTLGKKGYDAVRAQMREVAKSAYGLRERLILAIDRDIDAYDRVVRAYGLPRDTEEHRTARNAAIREAYREATIVPLEVARAAITVIDLAEIVIAHGNRNALSDGLAGAMLARTAVLTAVYNVRVNVRYIRDEVFEKSVLAEAESLHFEAIRKEQQILSSVDLGDSRQ